MNGKIPNWLIPSIVLAAILSCVSISYRFHVESRNKAATIAIEVETAEALALGQGEPLDKALRHLKLEGLGALVLTEETIGDLMTAHQIEVVDGANRQLRAEPKTLDRVLRAIARRYPALDLKASNGAIDLSGPDMPSIYNLRGVSVGLDVDEAAAARTAGLRIIGRYGNPLGATDAYVRATLTEARAQGADIFLPVGDQVLGRRGGTKALEDTLQELGMLYASPEFAKLGGDENVVSDIPESIVRLHSAQAAELDRLPLSEAVDRYAKAARERNQRVLLLRAVNFNAASPVDDMGDFIHRIVKEVEKQGGEIGAAKPFETYRVPSALFALVGLSLAPGIWFSVAYFVKNPRVRWVGAALIALLGAACYAHQARPVMAFLASVAFPILAFQLLQERKLRSWPVEYFLVSFVSFVGGLGIAGLLNGLPYLVRAEQFEGVKVAVFLPIAVIAAMSYSNLADLKGALKSPIFWSQAGLTLALLGALAFMISRTGNDNPAGVSGIELKFRYLLDTLLFVRPRTKEFMIGHPFLIVGLCMLARLRAGGPLPKGFAGWAALALAVGAVGQTDIVNTMCHFHTPVALSLARIGVGLVAGGILGMVLWGFIGIWLPRNGESIGGNSNPGPEIDIAH